MKRFFLPLIILTFFIIPGCELAGDIFEAGFTVGIIAVVLVVALIIYLIRKMRR